MATPLLTTKLYIPPPRPDPSTGLRTSLVERPRLVKQLDEGLRLGHRMTLVSAPAGFGKTTLLSEWVHAIGGISPPIAAMGGISPPIAAMGGETSPIAVAWLSLDEGDNDLTRFLAYVVAALQTIDGNVGQGVLAALQSPGAVNVEVVLTTLINEIADLPDNPSTGPRQAQADSPGRDLILVLDDYHVIESQPIDKALTFFLDHLPPPPGGLHLVVASRSDPALPLSRLRARSQLTELREGDLRFTGDEAAAFLKEVIRLPVSPEDVSTLEKRTEGWITGLQLAAMAMQGLEEPDRISRFVCSFSGSHRYVIDYLVDEVLDQQPPRVQEFLLRTSILDRMTASLCNVVASREDSQAVLEGLEAANLFLIPLDNERRWYRYHHLFVDLLRQRLRQNPHFISPDGGDRGGSMAELHTRASAWYEENGLEIEALHHAAAANDFERAARLVEGEGNPLYHRGAVTPVLKWLESLPTSLLDARPSLWVMYAEVLITRGRLADAAQAYQAAETALGDVEQDAGQDAEHLACTRDLLGRIANGRASLAGLQRQPERMIVLARRALDLLHPDNLAIRAAAGLSLGYAYQLQGDRVAAGQTFAEAIANGQTAGHIIVTMLATQSLGDIQAGENRLRQAAQTYRRALELAGERPLPYTGDAHLGLAQILYEWNDLDAAHRHGQQGLQLTRQIEHTDKSIAAEIFLARLKLARGDVPGAAAILDEVSRSIQQHHFSFCLPEAVAAQVLVSLRQGDLAAAARLAQTHDLPISQARVRLAQGDAAGALAMLDPLRQQMEAKGWQDELLKVMVLQAVALQRMQHPTFGDKDRALQHLGDALASAEPGGFIRIFVDEGAPMARLLVQAAARGMMPDYTAKLLAAFEDATKDEEPALRRAYGPMPKGRMTQLSPSAPAMGCSPGESMGRPPSESRGETEGPALSEIEGLIEPLSQRELEVLQLIAQGLSNREISERLFLALSTVKGHNRNIYGKLQVQRRTEAIARARELDLV